MNDIHIGQRVKALREGKGMRQDELATLLGLNSRQIVSQIETGTRRLTASELVAILDHFGETLERLTNPFLLMGKSSFSWRQHQVPRERLDAFESKAGEWIGAYRELNELRSRQPKLLPNTRLTYASSFEDAAAVGERVAEQLELGDTPAFKLAEVMEDQLDILVLMVDAEPGISGAACQLPELSAVLINRQESFARRNSDLAHELFHILTWNEIKPAHVESSVQSWDIPTKPKSHNAKRDQRIEQLADNFAAALLMPPRSLDLIGKPRGGQAQWLVEAAAFLGVSSRALKWRLVNSGRAPELNGLKEGDLVAAMQSRVDGNGSQELPPLFSKRFIATIASGVEQGNLSGRRAAALLGLDQQLIGELCETYGLPRPVELGGQATLEPSQA